ncbi:MAG TPA: efflux RND transporter periplasmic adaptor subunit [Polyangiales bacterium]|nr:efflux RND transporter periplasmic adaptor subunit [Polyangiales bacterium]
MTKYFFLLNLGVIALSACGSAHQEPSNAPAAAPKSASTIQILATAANRAGIRVATVEREHMARMITAPAEIVLDPDRTAHLTPLTPARLEKVTAKLGDQVRAGTVLALLRSVAVGETRASVAQSEADVDLAHATLKRQEELRASNIGATRSYEEAVAAAKRAEAAAAAARERSSVVGSYELRAPIAGTVIARHATIGETVGPETVLFTIADLSQVWVVGQVYERDVGAVAPQVAAKLKLAAYPERTWTGTISYVAGAVEHETRTLPVHMILPNTDGALRPGLFGSLAIETADAVDTLAVPADAIQHIGDKTVAFVSESSPDPVHVRFAARDVTLGRETDDLVEVKTGLQSGESIAIAGTFTLRGEMLRDTLTEED